MEMETRNLLINYRLLFQLNCMASYPAHENNEKTQEECEKIGSPWRCS